MVKRMFLGWLLTVFATAMWAQDANDFNRLQRKLQDFFEDYKTPVEGVRLNSRLISCKTDDMSQTLTITADDRFARQQFTRETVSHIYKKVKKCVPGAFDDYKLRVVTNGMALEEMIPNRLKDQDDNRMSWGRIDYDGNPWVTNVSKPLQPRHGLQGRHLAISASHGRYYDIGKGRWKWQRPNLFCTTEDLFTQTIVIPYLIPMLENAGAIVWSSRERDWQKAEYIIDNDDALHPEWYKESNGWQPAPGAGFAYHTGTYAAGENPFRAGTARMAQATSSAKKAGSILYQPRFQKAGRHAVYVSYTTLQNSVDDAEYSVYHKGQRTVFHVNQRMGGNTWVYLGTFDFDEGCSTANCVVLTNYSRSGGYVTADAVKIGGGMGNVTRGGSSSGLPRTLEGTRYFAQWAGAPDSVYSPFNGKDDYRDDLNSRSYFATWLAGGSVFVPNAQGKRVPLELQLSIHSDAGWDKTGGNELVGSLSICTTDHNGGRLNSGVTRDVSRFFATALLDGAYRDLQTKFHKWTKRTLYDRNYSETRLPSVPSAILETLSHQNFGDLKYGFDPNFRFTLARSVYKTILRFVSDMHDIPFTVQPLAPNNFRMEMSSKGRVKLSWNPVLDPQEATSIPTRYVLYTAVGNGGFDNGIVIKTNQCAIDLQPGLLYHFKVTAANDGGESFPTEVLSAAYQPHAASTVMVVNGFHRLSSPSIVDTGDRKGFDLDDDIGVTYGPMPGWAGRQKVFDNNLRGREGENALGFCSDELTGRFIAGNDFDQVRTHAAAIHSAGKYNIISVSSEAVESGRTKLSQADCVDLMLGLEKDDGHSLVIYKTFSAMMRQQLEAYLKKGGRLMTSGAYIGSDMTSASERRFLNDVLRLSYGGSARGTQNSTISGMGMNFDTYRTLNEQHYAAVAPDVLQHTAQSICALQYADGRSAAVAYSGRDCRTFTIGFPFECICREADRNAVMRGILNYLLK